MPLSLVILRRERGKKVNFLLPMIRCSIPIDATLGARAGPTDTMGHTRISRFLWENDSVTCCGDDSKRVYIYTALRGAWELYQRQFLAVVSQESHSIEYKHKQKLDHANAQRACVFIGVIHNLYLLRANHYNRASCGAYILAFDKTLLRGERP